MNIFLFNKYMDPGEIKDENSKLNRRRIGNPNFLVQKTESGLAWYSKVPYAATHHWGWNHCS